MHSAESNYAALRTPAEIDSAHTAAPNSTVLRKTQNAIKRNGEHSNSKLVGFAHKTELGSAVLCTCLDNTRLIKILDNAYSKIEYKKVHTIDSIEAYAGRNSGKPGDENLMIQSL